MASVPNSFVKYAYPCGHGFLDAKDLRSLFCVSKRCHEAAIQEILFSAAFLQIPANFLKPFSPPSPYATMIGSGLTECHCCPSFRRLPYALDLRKIAEDTVVGTLQNKVPNKTNISICTLFEGGCFQALVLHIKLVRSGKVPHWVLIDRFYEQKKGKEFVKEFEKKAKQICPFSTITSPTLLETNEYPTLFHHVNHHPIDVLFVFDPSPTVSCQLQEAADILFSNVQNIQEFPFLSVEGYMTEKPPLVSLNVKWFPGKEEKPLSLFSMQGDRRETFQCSENLNSDSRN